MARPRLSPVSPLTSGQVLIAHGLGRLTLEDFKVSLVIRFFFEAASGGGFSFPL